MKKIAVVLLTLGMVCSMKGQIVTHYQLPVPSITEHQGYALLQSEGMMQSALSGNPTVPWQHVAVLLPAGTEATYLKVDLSDPVELVSGTNLFPYQSSRPISEGSGGRFEKNETVYNSKATYPSENQGRLSTHFLYGHSVAFSTFTPVSYIPATGKLVWFTKASVEIGFEPTNRGARALQNLSAGTTTISTLQNLVKNPELLNHYPAAATKGSPVGLLIITPAQFHDGFAALREYYSTLGISSELITPDDIYSSQNGVDNQEKIRNYLINRVQQGGVDYVLLGGDVDQVPVRGLYCQVNSQGSIYEDQAIPSDLYYSALDGTWDNNGNNLWGEPDEDDLLPELAVARLPYSTVAEQQRMLHKVLQYQQNPVGDELTNTLMAGEDLYSNPQTWGGDYLDLLIGHSEENGYTTDGIPEAFPIQKMYDRDMGFWSKQQLIDKINSGMTFIHHSGHSNVDYAMRMSNWDITDANFSGVNGTDHNYCLVYTHGCICGAFDANDCIAEEMLKIQNFVVAGGFNSRYGWFNEGQTEGPSEHLHREFVNALYTMGIKRIGQTQVQSKVATAPWVEAPGQWEEGALRWCFYDNNILGDAAMLIHTDNLVATQEIPSPEKIILYPNPANNEINITLPDDKQAVKTISIFELTGKMVTTIQSSDIKNTNFGVRLAVGVVPTGTYLVRVETSNGSYTTLLTIAR